MIPDSRPIFRSAAFAISLSLAALPAPAQDDVTPDLPDLLGEIVDVRVVNVEVVVTDPQGLRVQGLSRDDFRLRVDGGEVPIDYFTEVAGGQAVAVSETSAPGPPQVRPGEPVGTSYLLFLDEYFAIPRDRDKVLRGLIDDLPHLGPEDRMAVVAYDGRRLEMLGSWSSSPRELERTLRRAMDRRAYGVHRVRDLRSFERGFDHAQRYFDMLEDQTERVTAAAAATLRGFASPPGRKVMLLLAGGWPADPVAFGLARFDPFYTAGRFAGAARSLERLADTANQLGYTLYPIDVAGFRGGDAVDAERTVPGRDTGFYRELEEHATLSQLAQATGGRVMLNARRLDALERVAADTRSYYWLGFTPAWRGDNASHRIEVEMARPGLEARSRRDFRDLSKSAEVGMRVESALLFGDIPGAEALDVELGETRRAGWGKALVPLTVRVPLDAVAMLPYRDGYAARLELRVAVIDEAGARSDIPAVPVLLTGSRAPEPGEIGLIEHTLKMRHKKHDLIVAVYDPAGGEILSTRLAVDP